MNLFKYLRNLFPRFIIINDKVFPKQNYRQVIGKNLNNNKCRKIWPSELNGNKMFLWTRFFIIE